MSKNKLIMITGATSGFGYEIAKLFSSKGYPLVLFGRRIERLKKLKSNNILIYKCDIRNFEQMHKYMKEAELKMKKKIDCLINNAGIMILGKIQNQKIKDFQRTFDVNVIGVVNCMQFVINDMIKRKTGTIINISSLAGVKTFDNHSIYCGSKFALHAITETTRQELSPHNIRVIEICPGAFETELLSQTYDKEIVNNYEQWKKNINGAGNPLYIAKAVYYAYTQPQEINIRRLLINTTKQVN